MGTRIKCLCLIVVAIFALAGAPESSRRTVAMENSEPKANGETSADTSGGASVSGTVTLAGSKGAPSRINMASDPACLKLHSEPVMSDQVVTGANGALANVVVYISDGLANHSFNAPEKPAVLEQKGCVYSPRIVGMQTSQTLHIVNGDPMAHNIRVTPQNNQAWNMLEFQGALPVEKTFAHPEIIPVKCDVHSWMKGYIAVFKHPYFVITHKDGAFNLQNVPPGDYTIQAWHEKYGTLTQKVTVEPNQIKTLEFVFKP